MGKELIDQHIILQQKAWCGFLTNLILYYKEL